MLIRALLLILVAQAAVAGAPDGGGALPVPTHAADRAFIDRALLRARDRSAKLRALKGPSTEAAVPAPALIWPVRKSISVTDPDVFGISNFVDQDPSEGPIGDYNCMERTYDGHRGLDIFLAPFSWYKMERDEGIVIAAAGGTIMDKVNDQPERSCTIDNSGGENNLVIIEHNDGSWGVYAHMRTGSLTAKEIGDTVTAGEYLGVVGSSGYSTGPHLHFEIGVWETEGNSQVWTTRDPFTGLCNDLNAESWWQEQPAYYQPTLNSVSTHSEPPEVPACPETERPHFENSFTAGETLYVANYYRDQLKDQLSKMKIVMPNGGIYGDWDHASDQEHYAASFWFWEITLPANAQSGKWQFVVEFEGQTVTHDFWVDAVSDPPPGMPDINNAFNGLWFAPLLDGEGYNVVTAGPGTIIYFYGSDADGNRLWLISELFTSPFAIGVQHEIIMYESTGGSHAAPVASARGLSEWGTLKVTFSDCDTATAELDGADGSKTAQLIKLAAVPGTGCGGDQTAEGGFSGLFYDPAFDGEGYNLVVSANGAVIFYYGFDRNGQRLWLIAGPIPEELKAGETYVVDLFRADSGTFDDPVPSAQALVKWGTLTLKVTGCNKMRYSMDTQEGDKVSVSVRLAGVVGINCN